MDITQAFRSGAVAPYTVYVNKYSHAGSDLMRFSLPPTPKLLARLQRDGGWTLNPRTGRFVTGAGYVVANPPGALGARKTASQLAQEPGTFLNVAARNADLLAKPGMMLGAWLDTETGDTYVEVSEVFARPSDAIRVARARGELAIFDLYSKQEIRVTSTERVV